MQVLDKNLGAVGLERYTVIAIVDDAVLNDNVIAAIRIPPVGVFGSIVGTAQAGNGNVVE